MPEYRDTFDDFNLKWAGTYAYWNDQLVYVHRAITVDDEDKEIEPSVCLYIRDKKQNIPNFDLMCLKPILFNSQFFNCVDNEVNAPLVKTSACLHIARNSRRQNKRSVCSENTNITSPFRPIIAGVQSRWPSSYQMNYDYIERALQFRFPSYNTALAMCNNYYMVAISPNFAVALSNRSESKFLLASIYGFIGEADATTLYIHHHGSYQEVNDFVTRNNLGLQVRYASS